MTREEARNLAVGYAWGREDEARKYGPGFTTSPGKGQHFSEAYANAQRDYNEHKRANMPSVSLAWRNWQTSRGRTIDPGRTVTVTVAVQVPPAVTDVDVTGAVSHSLRNEEPLGWPATVSIPE